MPPSSPARLPFPLLAAGALALGVAAITLGRSTRTAVEDAPFLPAGDSEVLERLPVSGRDPRSRALAQLRAQLQADPRNLSLAVQLARADIEESRARSDPRFLGHAEAALAPWWADARAPDPVLLLRATVRQSTHDFGGALQDLGVLLQRSPQDAQALLTRSVILTVQGRYREAREDCERLQPLTRPLVYGVCAASVDSLTGDAAGAYARLSEQVAAGAAGGELELAWAQSVLGEVALRAGDAAAAERHLRAALAVDSTDSYALGALADLLLDTARPAEAAALLAGQTHNDGLLLRLALAARAARLPHAEAEVQALRERFRASAARGDVVHRREEARFRLQLEGDAAGALRLAQANWEVQREPWDLRVLLEAALAAGDAAAAAPALAALRQSGLQDPALRALAGRLQELQR